MKKLLFGLYCVSAVHFGIANDQIKIPTYDEYEEYEEASGPSASSSVLSPSEAPKSVPSPPIDSSKLGFMRRSPGLYNLSQLAAEKSLPRSSSAPPMSALESKTHLMKRSPGYSNLSQFISRSRFQKVPHPSAVRKDTPLTPKEIREVSQILAPIPVRATNSTAITLDPLSSSPKRPLPLSPLESAEALFDSSTDPLDNY